ncbi:hypothetical protein BKP45_00880 [Anaerobacillus alkalidiazotrophicus]|uniref:Uncharacterized protein n=1 Tax=Anaerobacillus alkalidiazotrophicus TaxID=472963 RepID=A0A1S2MCF8_9BACI|nr:hypothetical protein [Anaerobacillus alkalidiazotrophicus]OIJ21365.1 hypothetical protein BKP45_00880 [Anaerobacillus alkalidiazotrophicus]
MYSFVFALISLAMVLLYGMLHTFLFVNKMRQELEDKRKYLRYGSILGIFGCVSLCLGIILYFYGVG